MRPMPKIPLPVCKDCGKKITNAKHKNRRICDDCRNNRKKEYYRGYIKEHYWAKIKNKNEEKLI